MPKDVVRARIAARKGDASDATPELVERQYAYELGEIGWKRGEARRLAAVLRGR